MDSLKTTPPFTLLVNSTDSYADCWPPFFILLEKYWPQVPEPIYVNAETAEYNGPGTKKVISTRSQRAVKKGRPTWTESMAWALEQVPTDYVLYVQEDYFLHAPVRHDVVADLVRLMQERSITYINLVEFGNTGPFTPSGFDDRLWEVGQKDKYRISLQACLFNKHAFAKYFERHENPWQFEFYGNKRAHRRKDTFYTINRDMYKDDPIFPYNPTGIQMARWRADVVKDLFAREGISVDYDRRGFFTGKEFKKKPITVSRVIDYLKSLSSVIKS